MTTKELYKTYVRNMREKYGLTAKECASYSTWKKAVGL